MIDHATQRVFLGLGVEDRKDINQMPAFLCFNSRVPHESGIRGCQSSLTEKLVAQSTKSYDMEIMEHGPGFAPGSTDLQSVA